MGSSGVCLADIAYISTPRWYVGIFMYPHDWRRDKQNPDSPGERERIEAMGGFVSDPEESGASARVWLDATQTMVGLAMARSIGDLAVKRVSPVITRCMSYVYFQSSLCCSYTSACQACGKPLFVSA